MNTKKRLNCYVFSNLMVSFLALNVITNTPSIELVKRTSSNTLNKIYESEIITSIVNVPDTTIINDDAPSVITVSNKTVRSERVESSTSKSYVKPSYNSVTGTNLVNYARNYLGLRYVSAGNSLQTGTDCSGFTRLIYKEFGINLGRTVSSQVYSGTYVSKSDLQPGDLVFYSYGSVASHVAIYMGNGLIIHESNPRDGVKISSVNIMNYITARRLITASVTNNVSSSTTEVTKEVKEEVKQEEKTEIKNEVTTEVKQEVVEKSNDNIVKDSNETKTETNKTNKEVVEEEVKKEIKEEVKEEKKQEEVKEVVESKENKVTSETSKESVVNTTTIEETKSNSLEKKVSENTEIQEDIEANNEKNK